ncbi:YoaK family protein [Actinospica sp.]|jgi:uncharacterized membrane protein YoaK (UPF0700 family)|uniref:YoaK family protein n=1 Tax=Actinospica sp. TaxID=1872142 RepID=UPI002CEE6D5E|nr:YoaK family protein [Actinospica sp.]HWG24351.1 YoaK family protein [Actinospica sp.]
MRGALRDAWTTIAPDMSDRHGPLPPMMLILTVVTGLVDAFSYLSLGHVFVANMTGNVVFVGFSLVGAAGFSLAASLVALAAFAAGAFVGGRIVHRLRTHRGRMLRLALMTQTVLVLAAYVVAQVVDAPYLAGARYSLIVLLAMGMGVQNVSARALAVPDLTTTVLTMTITGMASDTRAAGGAGGKVGRRALSAVAMLVGALVGAEAVLHGHSALPLLIALALLAADTVLVFPLARSEAPWTKPL